MRTLVPSIPAGLALVGCSHSSAPSSSIPNPGNILFAIDAITGKLILVGP